MSQQLPLTEKTSGGCGCGCGHETATPELDARTIPHAIRHGAILGAIDQVKPGQAMVLVAPHDPLPLLAQVRELFGDRVEISYVDREDPEAVRVRFAKVAPAMPGR